MRYLAFLIILCFFISCQRKDKAHAGGDLLYSVDTVIINSKGRLLDLDLGILKSDLNDEENSIFLYNKFDHSIDEVNLDDLEVVNNYSFDAEGPDGTGEHIYDIYLLKNDLFFIKSNNESAVFDRNGDLLKKIDWVNSIDENGLMYGLIPNYEIAIGSNGFKVFGLTYDNYNRDVYFDVLSVQDNSVVRYDIDSVKSYHNFVLKIDDPENYIFLDPVVFSKFENDFIIVSHQFSNEIYLFNSEGEYVQTVNYDTKLTPKRVKDLNGISMGSFEQLQKEYQHFLEQVRFGPPVWDRVKKRYFRLSAIRIFRDRQAEDSLLPEIKEVKVYLSVFDADFNLISEAAIPELYGYGKYFAKDGKLWVFQNLSDELGFIVIDV